MKGKPFDLDIRGPNYCGTFEGGLNWAMALERGLPKSRKDAFDPQGKPALPTRTGLYSVGRGVLVPCGRLSG